MKFTFFIIISFFIMNIFSIQILKKYGSLKVNEEFVIFESDSFSLEENMFFKISTGEYCEDYLYYEYYNDNDDLSSLSLYPPLYFVMQTSQSSMKENDQITSMTRYFTIDKKKTELNSSNGKYLLLNYKCNSQYEIENTESDGSTTIIIIIIIVFCVIIVIIIIVTVVYCYRRKVRLMLMNRQIPYKYVIPHEGSAYCQQSKDDPKTWDPVQKNSYHDNKPNNNNGPSDNISGNNHNHKKEPQDKYSILQEKCVYPYPYPYSYPYPYPYPFPYPYPYPFPYPQIPNNQMAYQNPQPIYIYPSNVPGSNV